MIATPRALERRDISTLAEFLVRVYKFAPDDHHADPRLLEWKYLSPRSGWPGSRSYVLEKNGQIVAHCGVCPVTFQLSNGAVIEATTMMDWAADPAVPGIGVSLFRKLMAMSPVSFLVGGSTATRQIALRIGFEKVGEADTFSAWLRPWREFRERDRTGRSILRLIHGIAHPLRGPAQHGDSWEVSQVIEFDDSLQPLLKSAPRRWTVCKRTLADLNYLLQCPHLETTGFLLLRQARLAGYFIVVRSDWEARVLDVSLDSDNLGDWEAAVHIITKTIRRTPATCRVRVQASFPILSKALERNGYWRQYAEPIVIHDPSHALAGAFPAAFQLCDGDAGY